MKNKKVSRKAESGSARKKVEKSIELGGRKLTLRTGVLAEQATGAVLASYGETVVLATVVAAPLKIDLGYFPLMVDYQERLYAGGRIKGSRWVKREGRPTDDEILTSRLIDRSIRPLFPDTYKKEVQVIITVLSVDIENDPSVLAGVATSAALAVSSIPWKGPIAMVKVGFKDKAYFTNPLDSEMKYSEMDLVVSATSDAVVMIEAGAKEISEEVVLEGVEYAQKESEKILELINELVKSSGVEKEPLGQAAKDPELEKKAKELAGDRIKELVAATSFKESGSGELDQIKKAIHGELPDKDFSLVSSTVEKMFKNTVREMILSGKRPDGRTYAQIRPLSAEVGVLPRTHGSAVFQRGQTQVLTVTTLGAPNMEQLIETAEGEESKRYIHHYSFPPYSTGEAGKIGSPSRREIGHGALAERALEPVIPDANAFPYTIRVVSEVMSSNGSTSMASACASSLSLMDAGVPLTASVSGIAMGLIIESRDKYAILSDIMGLEDFNGDMDFKVAGTNKGITALQLDVKTLNLTSKILKEALGQAKKGRAEIMKVITKTIGEPRAKVSTFAPKIKVVKIPVEKIGEIIGPGGRMIKKIIAETSAQVEVEDDGSVNVSGPTEEILNSAVERIEALTKDVVAGEIYDGVVKRIQPFGAFVEILPGKDGLVHVSDMGEEFVSDPNDVVKIDDKVKVRVKEIDNLGRINLSMNMDPARDKPREERAGGGDRDRGRGRSRYGESRDGGRRDFGGSRSGSRGGFGQADRRFSPRGGGYNRDRRGGPRQGGSGGPHFPTSRLVEDRKKDFDR
ncbi:polyribonucleotide nucleotidyltransferase [Candidatus Woesebacteria bacterium GWB1_43_5]|uniref:Polyribonucleotide nucleotidyltransferase n=1 Tax=Candidatus Woesebacteria bacterium GWB1_43_5 TaxID=1802474 RepID=A0A1F7WTZ8_9BACT|nr:MAG: polyribonucleotide nucleotidyltransferase [Candidatus Woesebacteria bacterium GWB1_43_5]